MSRRRHCKGHAQFHGREPLKASARPDSLRLHFQRIFLFFCFPQELLPLILNCLASPSSRSVCFHYANTEPVAGLMFFFTFLDGRRDRGKLTCLPLAGTYEKLVFRNVINHRATGRDGVSKL